MSFTQQMNPDVIIEVPPTETELAIWRNAGEVKPLVVEECQVCHARVMATGQLCDPWKHHFDWCEEWAARGETSLT